LDFSGNEEQITTDGISRSISTWLPANVDIQDENYNVESPFFLHRNYPNPFNPETTIEYSIKEDSRILIEIYNIKGQKVKTLINEFREAGYYSVIWNGKDNSNKQVASGLYFYRMKTANYNKMRKILLLK